MSRCEVNLFLFFQCGDATETEAERRCDGAPDCAGGADETGCEEAEPMFDCGGGELVLQTDRCDGELNCVSGRDEAACPPRALTTCPSGF